MVSKTKIFVRKGLDFAVLALVVAVIGLIGLMWYQSNVLSGGELSKEIVESFSAMRTGKEFINSVIYLEEALRDNVANDSLLIGSLGGRNGSEAKYRYWRCDPGNVIDSGREKLNQVPTAERVRLSFQNLTTERFLNRILELHGIRDNVIYDVGDIICTEVGYNNPRDSPANDRFKAAMLFKYLGVTFGNYKDFKENLTVTNEINYNRFWYLYEVMAKWANYIINYSIMQQNVEQELAKVPDYLDDYFCCGCPCPYQKGCEAIPMKWREYVPEAVHKGVNKTVDILNEEEYFDKNEVLCTYNFGQEYYDNIPILTRAIVGSCYEGCLLWYCRLDYIYRIEIDANITCTDKRYTSIPRKDLERAKFVVTMNLEAEDPPNEGEYPSPCDTVKGQPCDFIPRPPVCRIRDPDTECDFDESPSRIGDPYFPECKIEQENFSLCSTGVQTIGNLTKKEIEDYDLTKRG
jgi:hypothetical protein